MSNKMSQKFFQKHLLLIEASFFVPFESTLEVINTLLICRLKFKSSLVASLCAEGGQRNGGEAIVFVSQ